MTDRVTTFLARAKVVLTALLTWLIVLAVVLNSAAGTISDHAPQGWEMATEWLARLAAIVGAAILALRNVTTVLPDQRGLLPEPGTQVITKTVPAGADVDPVYGDAA